MSGFWEWGTRRRQGQFRHFFSADKIFNESVTSRLCQLCAQWALGATSSAGPTDHSSAHITLPVCVVATSQLPFPSTTLCLFESLFLTHWLLLFSAPECPEKWWYKMGYPGNQMQDLVLAGPWWVRSCSLHVGLGLPLPSQENLQVLDKHHVLNNTLSPACLVKEAAFMFTSSNRKV